MAAIGASLTFAWLWTLFAGKDVSWDLVNHHVYLPFSLLSGRFLADLHAAGPQAYQNPLGYLPFHALTLAPVPAWVAGFVLAAVHALCAWPLHRLASRIWPSPGERLWRALAVMAALLSPVYLITLGTSSIDPYSNLLLLSALAALWSTSTTAAVLAGMAVGLALTLKLTNVVFALPLLVLAAARAWRGDWRPAQLAWAVSAGVATLALTTGPWAWFLWHQFGNPLYPLFNTWFGSPYAPMDPIRAVRFVMQSPGDLLARPFELALFRTYAATEAFAPDLRPAALLLATPPALWLARRRAAVEREPGSQPVRATAALALFSLAAYVLWAWTSANLRYALPLAALIGLLMVRAVQSALPERVARSALLLLLLLQAVYFGFEGEKRYTAVPWDSGPWLVVQPHPRLVNEPFLHLSVGSLSLAAIAPGLHHQGALVNVIGQWSLPSDGPMGEMLADRRRAWEGRTRLLFRAADGADTAPGAEQFRQRIDRSVLRFGIEADWKDCLPVVLASGLDLVDPPAADATPAARPTGLRTLVLSCGIRTSPGLSAADIAERDRVDRVYERLESACPRLLSTRPWVTDADIGAWQRKYPNTDLRLTISVAEGVWLSHFRSVNPSFLGSLAEVEASDGRAACQAASALIQFQ
jgi:hypothetical protein